MKIICEQFLGRLGWSWGGLEGFLGGHSGVMRECHTSLKKLRFRPFLHMPIFKKNENRAIFAHAYFKKNEIQAIFAHAYF